MADDDKTGDHTRSFSSMSFVKEYPTAVDFKDVMASIMSDCFQFLSLANVRRALPHIKDENLLREKHAEMMTESRDFMTEKLTEICDETDAISSLNELYKLTQSQPLTFEKVWRPSGSASVDVEAHLAQAHFKFESLATQLFNDLQRGNSEKKADIIRCENEIKALTKEIAATANNLKAAELAAANEVHAALSSDDEDPA